MSRALSRAMSRAWFSAAVAAIVPIALSSAARADEIVLAGGGVLRGTVLKESPDALFLDLGFGVVSVPRSPRRCTMRCGTPRSGTSTPSANGAASGSRLSRAAIQPPCFCANSLASFTLPRGGIVRTTSREAASIRKV